MQRRFLAIPQPLYPPLGPKGRLYVSLAVVLSFEGFPHAHRLDWIWLAVSLAGVCLTAWKAAASVPDSTGPDDGAGHALPKVSE